MRSRIIGANRESERRQKWRAQHITKTHYKNADEKKSSGTEDFFISFDSAYYSG
jgi:hypothetical protein